MAHDPSRPFIKWAGGKRWLSRFDLSIPALASDSTYREPFVGSGALFFSRRWPRAYLADSNRELIRTYIQVRDNVDCVIEVLCNLRDTPDDYYRLRAHTHHESEAESAARFIYLNRTAYGGLYRVNKLGQFNVPYSGVRPRDLVQRDILRAASDRLNSVSLVTQDFSASLATVNPGDFVFADPPYYSAGQAESFARYNSDVFGLADHEELARILNGAASAGAHVVHTNSTAPIIRSLYSDFYVKHLTRRNNFNRGGRHVHSEAIYSSYELRPLPTAMSVNSYSQ